MRSAIITSLLFGLAILAPANAADTVDASDLILVIDGSNSMWGQIDGVNKIVIAREAVGQLIDDLPETTQVGLVAYGHRRESDCADIEVLSPIFALDKEPLKATINGINPKGKTPIAASIDAAVDVAKDSEHAAIVLISDGLETCGLDPCEAVRNARATELPFVLHVIGFDMADEDTAQLECAAQAGGGLYLAADDAAQLSDALRTAYEKPSVPDGGLVVTATADGELQDAMIRIVAAATGEYVAGGRTYYSDDTNPRRIPLEDGQYTAVVSAVGVKGSSDFDLAFEIVDGNAVEKAFDFSAGELSVGVTRNGELSDAVVTIYRKGARTNTAGGRTYKSASTNPKILRVAAGSYDVRIKSVEIRNGQEPVFENIVVNGNERTEIQHAFTSGELSVGTQRGESLVDAVVSIIDSNGMNVAGRRTYANGSSNPVTFVLTPGDYAIRIAEVRGDKAESSATVTAGENTTVIVDLDAP